MPQCTPTQHNNKKKMQRPLMSLRKALLLFLLAGMDESMIGIWLI
jgi:hypothetical protein